MPASSGVITKKNKKGEVTEVIINTRKHPQALPALKELGIVPKSEFEIACENAYTPEQLRDHLVNIVNNHYAGKH